MWILKLEHSMFLQFSHVQQLSPFSMKAISLKSKLPKCYFIIIGEVGNGIIWKYVNHSSITLHNHAMSFNFINLQIVCYMLLSLWNKTYFGSTSIFRKKDKTEKCSRKENVSSYLQNHSTEVTGWCFASSHSRIVLSPTPT